MISATITQHGKGGGQTGPKCGKSRGMSASRVVVHTLLLTPYTSGITLTVGLFCSEFYDGLAVLFPNEHIYIHISCALI